MSGPRFIIPSPAQVAEWSAELSRKPASVGELYKQRSLYKRIIMIRLRLERRGIIIPGLPERKRAHRSVRRKRIERALLFCDFDISGEPIHGDALERLEKLCAWWDAQTGIIKGYSQVDVNGVQAI